MDCPKFQRGRLTDDQMPLPIAQFLLAFGFLGTGSLTGTLCNLSQDPPVGPLSQSGNSSISHSPTNFSSLCRLLLPAMPTNPTTITSQVQPLSLSGALAYFMRMIQLAPMPIISTMIRVYPILRLPAVKDTQSMLSTQPTQIR